MIKNKNLEKVIEKINENKKTIIIVLVLLLIMGAYSLYGKYQDANPDFSYEIIELEKRDLKKIISIDGKIVSDYEINLASEIPGIISKIYVKEGDYVKKGQLLMKLKDTDLRNQVNSAYANKQLAEVSLQKIKNPNQNIDKDSEIAKYNTEIIKNDIAKLNSDLEFNLSTLDTYLDQLLRLSIDDYFDHVETNPSFTYRIKSEIKTSALEEERKKLGLDWKEYSVSSEKKLSDAIIITGKFEKMINNLYRTSLDFLGFSDAEMEMKEKILSSLNTSVSERKKSLSTYKDNLSQLENRLKISSTESQKIENNVKKEDIDFANQQIKIARVQTSNAYLQLQKTNIRATRSGVISEILKEDGEYASPSSSLIKIISKEKYIKALIPEVDIAKIDLGMTVNIKIDSYKNKVFKGKIDFIYPSEKESQGVTYYEVKISLSEEEIKNINILPGMSLEVFITYDDKYNVLSVKRGIAKLDEKGYFVQIINEDKKKPIDEKFINKYFENGFIGDDYVEVISGLDKSDKIINIKDPIKKKK